MADLWLISNTQENRQTGGIPGLSLDEWINQQDHLSTLHSNSQTFGLMNPAELEFRQLRFEEINFALDPNRITDFSLAHGISPEQARAELIRTAAAALDNGWANALNEDNGNTQRAKDFLRQELISTGETGLFQVTQEAFNDERDGLKELMQNPEAFQTVIDNLALVHPTGYRTDPNYAALILDAKGRGSYQGISNVVEGTIDALTSPNQLSEALTSATLFLFALDAGQKWELASSFATGIQEDLSYYGYENTLHIMQGNVYDAEYAHAASSTAMGIGLGLAADAAWMGLYRQASLPDTQTGSKAGVNDFELRYDYDAWGGGFVANSVSSASKASSLFQGENPFWGVDELVNTGLAKGDKLVQLTYRKDGVPTSSYFTTVESLQKAQVGGGSIDANILNQGLQTYPGGRSDFKLYAQVFQVGDDIPTFAAARGSTTANPYFNPSQVDTLEQIFILDDFKSSLKPTNLIKLDNTKVPEYLPLDQITNNMLRLDTQ